MEDKYGSCIIDYEEYKQLMRSQFTARDHYHENVPDTHLSIQTARSKPSLSASKDTDRVSLSLSKSNNIFKQNRDLIKQLDIKQQEINKYRLIIKSVLEIIGKVFSKQAAHKIQDLIETFSVPDISLKVCRNRGLKLQQNFDTRQNCQKGLERELEKTIQEIILTSCENRHSQPPYIPNCRLLQSVQSIKGQNEKLQKITFAPFSPNSTKGHKTKTNKAKKVKNIKKEPLRHSISCVDGVQSSHRNDYYQNLVMKNMPDIEQFISESLQCTEQSQSLEQTQKQFQLLFSQLKGLKDQIQEQMQMLQFSKEKIDRDKERHKLEKDLIKVQRIIELKRKQLLLKSFKAHSQSEPVCHCLKNKGRKIR